MVQPVKTAGIPFTGNSGVQANVNDVREYFDFFTGEDLLRNISG
jgi:hypothetical protein